MKTNTFYLLLTMVITTLSCSRPIPENPKNWSEKQLSKWFQEGEWKSGWQVNPDESVDRKEFAVQFYKNKERWEKAFNFLKISNLENISLGRHELEGDALYANVDEYITKNEKDTRFEAHRKYADIQYLVFGKENIGVSALENTVENIPYNDEKDIAFLAAPQNNYRLASPERFFIFFPDDAHRPCRKAGESTKIRKIVVKVLIN